MTENKGKVPGSETVVLQAIAALSSRVTTLEKDSSVQVYSGDGSDARLTLAATLEELKALRTALLTSSTEVDERLKELDSVKKENEKMKYRIRHLLKTIEAEESKNGS